MGINIISMQIIKTFDNYFSANIVAGRLQQDGIACELLHENTVTIDPLVANAIGGIKLMVNAVDAVVAAQLPDDYEKEYVAQAECPKCGAVAMQRLYKPAALTLASRIKKMFSALYQDEPIKVFQCAICRYESATLPDKYAYYNKA